MLQFSIALMLLCTNLVTTSNKVEIFSSPGLTNVLLWLGDTEVSTAKACFEGCLIGPQLHQCAHVGSASL